MQVDLIKYIVEPLPRDLLFVTQTDTVEGLNPEVIS